MGIVSVADPSNKGIQVSRVVPGGAGDRIGLKVGDLISTLNGHKLTAPAQFVALVGTLHAGDKIDVGYIRSGLEAKVSGEIVERPRQTEPNLDVIYDQVVSRGKRIRIIITKPKSEGRFPTVFLIGGVGAYSVDAPFATMAYGAELGPLANAGYVTVRIDKPGQGDSEGPAYKDLTFAVERDAYLQALRLTKTLPFVDPNRVAIFGHSMGGCFAPLVAGDEPVKAVISSETIFEPLIEYMLENGRRQSELAGQPEDAIDQDQKQFAATMHYLFEEGQTPAQAAKSHPELAPFIKQIIRDGETYSGVGIPFFRELSKINLAKAWQGVNAEVLSTYCENDFLCGRSDQERIVDLLNKRRPGSAEFALIKDSDHLFAKTTSMKDSMARFGKGEFNPNVVGVLLDFLKRKLS